MFSGFHFARASRLKPSVASPSVAPRGWIWATPLAAILLSGCNGYSQSKPPTAEGLVLIKARTATGTRHTKLEAKSQPSPPRAGEVSIWDLKIFDIKDKATGERSEWKHLLPVPQSEETGNVSQVMMNAWIISRDKSVFLPRKPKYAAYGSFVTDWAIPKTGDYSLFAEYKPNGGASVRTLPIEIARWDFKVSTAAKGAESFVPLQPNRVRAASVGQETFEALGARGTKRTVQLRLEDIRAASRSSLNWSVAGAPDARNLDIAALSPDGEQLLHFPANRLTTIFGQSGTWRLWFSFEADGEQFIAPYDLTVAP